MTRDENRLECVIQCDTEEQRIALGESICSQLVGNSDFVNNKIVVDYTNKFRDVCVLVAPGVRFSLNVESDGNDIKVTMGGK